MEPFATFPGVQLQGKVSTVATRLEHVIARNAAALRAERGWTQVELAKEMIALGFSWSANRVAQIETLRRPVSVAEELGLCWVFGVPREALLAGEDSEEIVFSSERRTTTLRDLRAAARGESYQLINQRWDGLAKQIEQENDAATRDELRRLGQKLNLSGDDLNELCIKYFDRRFLDERDARAGDLTGVSKRSAQTSRGHASRSLLADLAQAIGDTDIEVIRKDLATRRIRRLRAGDPR